MTQGRYDLEDRLIEFAANVCRIGALLPPTPVGQHVNLQLVRSATSPFANYAEAVGAESRRDFVHKCGICHKELREVRAWLTFAHRMSLGRPELVVAAIRECGELVAIMSSSIRTARRRSRSGEKQNVQRPLIIEH